MPREPTLAHQVTTALCLVAVVTRLPYSPAARAQERAVRDVTPPGISRVFRNTVAVPDPAPPSTQEAQAPRMLENIRPQTDGSLRSGALVIHLAGVHVAPTQRLCTTSAGAR